MSEFPADNLAETHPSEEPESLGDNEKGISVSKEEDTNPPVLDPERGGAGALPDAEEYEQILEELHMAKTEQAVSLRRNHTLTLDTQKSRTDARFLQRMQGTGER